MTESLFKDYSKDIIVELSKVQLTSITKDLRHQVLRALNKSYVSLDDRHWHKEIGYNPLREIIVRKDGCIVVPNIDQQQQFITLCVLNVAYQNNLKVMTC